MTTHTPAPRTAADLLTAPSTPAELVATYARQADELAAAAESLFVSGSREDMVRGLRVLARALGEQHGELDDLAARLATVVSPTELRAMYRDRAHLLALATTHYQAFLTTDPAAPLPDCATVLIVYTPSGQWSWHIHTADLPLFSEVPEGDPGMWDGHTTDTKHWRMRREIRRLAPEQRSCSHAFGAVTH